MRQAKAPWVQGLRTGVPNERQGVSARQQHHVSETVVPLGTTFGLVLPTLLAWTWGDPWGGLFVAGFLRLLVEYHASFAINSFTHTFGRQPYSKASTARDGFVVALITFGERDHSSHHRFPGDSRNGVRAYHYDPTR
jgi:stearoyl-CoA desaturase (delta-9 desaturase)